MSIWLACMYIHHVCVCCLKMAEEGSDPLEIELQVVKSHHVGAGKWTQALGKSSQLLIAEPFFWPLSELFWGHPPPPINLMFLYIYVYITVCICTCKCLNWPEEDTGSPGAGVTSSCDHQVWVQGTKFWLFARVASDLNGCTSSLALFISKDIFHRPCSWR